MIEPPIDQNLLERRIEAPKLSPPNAFAPSEARFGKTAIEILRIERSEKRFEIVMRAGRPMLRAPRAPPAQSQLECPRSPRIGKLAIRFSET